MDILTDAEIDGLISRSKIAAKYNKVVDTESAYELLTQKLNEAAKEEEQIKQRKVEEKEERTSTKKDKGIFDDPIVKSMTRTAGNEIVRSLLGVLGLGSRSRRSKSLF
jgi:hypothetical protein